MYRVSIAGGLRSAGSLSFTMGVGVPCTRLIYTVSISVYLSGICQYWFLCGQVGAGWEGVEGVGRG